MKAATARIEKITQATLVKAFRGELVPTEADLARQENRDYEPASALLARIRAERNRVAPDSGHGDRRRGAKSPAGPEVGLSQRAAAEGRLVTCRRKARRGSPRE